MKTTDLNVTELTSTDLEETNGGILIEIALGMFAGWLIYELTHKE